MSEQPQPTDFLVENYDAIIDRLPDSVIVLQTSDGGKTEVVWAGFVPAAAVVETLRAVADSIEADHPQQQEADGDGAGS